MVGAAALVAAFLGLLAGVPTLYARVTDMLFGVNLAGTWCMLDEVTGPPGNPNIGNTSGFSLTIKRSGDRTYTAEGFKVSSSGKIARTPSNLSFDPFELDNDKRTQAYFDEDMHVAGRTYRGFFVWTYADATLTGNYHLTAGGIEGNSRLERSSDPNCRHLVTEPGST